MSHDSEKILNEERLLEQLAELRTRADGLAAELEHTHRLALLGTMAAVIAHELNNVLTPVAGYAQAALAAPDDPDLVQKALQCAAGGAGRASEIAESVLSFAGSHHGAAARARAADAVDGALACLARDPSREGITVDLDIDPDLTVAMTPVGLQQVLLNLVLNARRAMLPGGGRLTIRARNPGGKGVRGGGCSTWNGPVIEVEDTGRGIDPHLLALVFEPFVTGDSAAGAGVGLAVCKRLVEQAGGNISVQSEVGVGTRFTVRLPVIEAEAADSGNNGVRPARRSA